MPKYNDSGTGNLTLNPVLPAALYPGDSVWLLGTSAAAGQPPTPGIIQAPSDTNVLPEAVVIGERSLAAVMASRPGGGAPAGASLIVIASANPGVCEVDLQTAPMDADGAYVTQTANKISTWVGPSPAGTYVGVLEVASLNDAFASVKIITNPNAVKFAAKLVYV